MNKPFDDTETDPLHLKDPIFHVLRSCCAEGADKSGQGFASTHIDFSRRLVCWMVSLAYVCGTLKHHIESCSQSVSWSVNPLQHSLGHQLSNFHSWSPNQWRLERDRILFSVSVGTYNTITITIQSSSSRLLATLHPELTHNCHSPQPQCGEGYITLSHEVTSALHYMRDCPDMAEINFHAGHNAPQVWPHTAPVISITWLYSTSSYSPGSSTHPFLPRASSLTGGIEFTLVTMTYHNNKRTPAGVSSIVWGLSVPYKGGTVRQDPPSSMT